MKAAPAAMISAPYATAAPVVVAGVVAIVTLEPLGDDGVAAAPVVAAPVLDPERAAAQMATAAEAVSVRKSQNLSCCPDSGFI
jgi:hypothetical protein